MQKLTFAERILRDRATTILAATSPDRTGLQSSKEDILAALDWAASMFRQKLTEAEREAAAADIPDLLEARRLMVLAQIG